jgi:hypothetical protein
VPALDRDELTRVWGDAIFPALPTPVRSVYRTGRWLAVDGGDAVFAFDHPQFLQRGADRRADVEAALASHFGAPVGLRLVLAGAGAPPPGSPPPLAGLPTPGGPPPPVLAGSPPPAGPPVLAGPPPPAGPPTARPAAPPEPPPYEGPLPDRPPEDDEQMTALEFAQLEPAPGEPASVEARLFQAFPGTEEVIR